ASNPDLTLRRLPSEASARCINGRMHAHRDMIEQLLRVVAELANHEMHITRIIRRLRDRERMRRTQSILLHRNEGELTWHEAHRMLDWLELEMQRRSARHCAYHPILGVR